MIDAGGLQCERQRRNDIGEIRGIQKEKYGASVKVYSIGEVSRELCGGPHVANTREVGRFKILKEEASSAGVRRIRATAN